MKQAKLWILGVVLVFASGAWAQQDEAPPAADVSSADTTEDTAEDAAARALAVYEQGKLLYDARDYGGALARFDEAAAIEPGKARWQYNRGLALRKLGRIEEARAALLQSRALEPDYKRVEIDGKLNELAAAESGPQPLFEDWTPLWWILGFLGGCALIIWLLWRLASKASNYISPPPPSVTAEDLAPLEAKLRQAAEMLIQVENALRSGEDADLRALLSQATLAEQRAWHALDRARYNGAALDFVEQKVGEAHRAAQGAVQKARGLYGEAALQNGSERVGCYFCARPLANADFRMRVPLKRGAEVTEVLACPPCANIAAAGQPPPVKVRQLHDGRFQHWSEMLGYDPYTHRHLPFPNTTTVPAWQYTPSRSLGEVAAVAAGGALATGLAAYGVSKLLDLDNAGESAAAQAAAQAATQAAAKKASESRENRDWKDHS